MTTNVLSPNWRGQHADPIDPTTVRFKVAEAPIFADCQGCVFSGQHSQVCEQVAQIAHAAGLINCDDPLPNGRSLIYVIDKGDPRQLDLLESEAQQCIEHRTPLSRKTN